MSPAIRNLALEFINHHLRLERYESKIFNDVRQIRKEICNRLWPNTPAENVTILTANVVAHGANIDHQIELWDR
jgi:hypothetical protein